MPDAVQNQMQSPEKPEINSEGAKSPIKMPEVAGRSASPQPPAQPADDKAAAQNIAANLQSSQTQAQVKNDPSQTQSQQQPAKTTSDTEPYIRAAENVIEKDKNDPYKEEEDHEYVQIHYLKDRFGKDIKKG